VPTFSDSKGLLFIGGYNHPPNVDAAIWLCEEIMPDVWKALPDLPVTLLGSSPPDAVLALQSHRVHVPGYIPDVTSYFCSHRLFVAPLRYGAGMKGKVGQALAHALPSVLTPVAAEGFDLQNERDCLIADDAKGFARAIVRLYRDERLWTTFSEQSSRVIEPFGKKALGPHVISMVTHVLKSRDLQAAG
jgi:glycosyltransferase involved in cell wall biosynthesis